VDIQQRSDSRRRRGFLADVCAERALAVGETPCRGVQHRPEPGTNGPANELRQFYAYLKESHIALAIGIGMLTWSDQCGKHVEGYVPPGGSDYVAKRIKSLGGELAYIGIDEAFWFGRYYSGANACHASVDTLAADVAANFKAYQAIFPNVRLGDVEPLGPPPGGDRPGSSWA
jgi:hypothetical protein